MINGEAHYLSKKIVNIITSVAAIQVDGDTRATFVKRNFVIAVESKICEHRMRAVTARCGERVPQ